MEACRDELTVTVEGLGRCPTFVFDDGAVRGFYQLSIAGEVAEVALFFVDPPAIGGGVGRALWRHLVARAERAGARRIAVEADPRGHRLLPPDGRHAHRHRALGQRSRTRAALARTGARGPLTRWPAVRRRRSHPGPPASRARSIAKCVL